MPKLANADQSWKTNVFPRTKSGEIDVIRPGVPINAESQDELAAALEPCVVSDSPRVVLDLSRVEQFDSVGLEEIVDQRERFLQLGGDLKLAQPNGVCQDILRITGTSEFIDVYVNVESAVKSFSQ